MPIIPYNINNLISDLTASGITFPFMFGITPSMLVASPVNISAYPYTRFSGATINQWWQSAGFVTGFTNDKLDEVRTYSQNDPYIVGFDIETDDYINYFGQPISGVTRVTDNNNPIVYAIDAESETPFNLLIGTDGQTTGIRYRSYNDETYEVVDLDGNVTYLPKTEMRYVGEGWNATNTELFAYIRREYLLGIVSEPEIQSDVFIDRGQVTVLENHLRLSEIRSLDALLAHGNGYYKFSI